METSEIIDVRQKWIIIWAKFGLVRSAKIPFGYWFIFSLLIRTEEERGYNTRPECAWN